MKRINVLLLFLIGMTCLLQAAKVDTLKVYSEKMKREIPVLAVVPDMDEGIRCPVLYLLHGYGDTYTAWSRITDLNALADTYHMMIVCPDGEKSWYLDSPVDPNVQFETFISLELPAYIDKHYPTYAVREGRAITGLSMGGHGAMWNGIHHPGVFGAVGSTSGGVDICRFPNCWQIEKVLGNAYENEEVWKAHSVYHSLDRLLGSRQSVIIDCGYSDFFYKVNQNVHERLRELNVKHDFYVRPGGHNSEYWRTSIQYQVLFFANYFKKALASKK